MEKQIFIFPASAKEIVAIISSAAAARISKAIAAKTKKIVEKNIKNKDCTWRKYTNSWLQQVTKSKKKRMSAEAKRALKITF